MRYPLTFAFTVTTLIISSLATPPSFAGEKLYIQTPAVYSKNAAISDDVKQECALDNKVSQYVQEAADRNFDIVPIKSVSEAGTHKALTLTIVGVQGFGGGSWSGRKGVLVRGALMENGKEIGSFVAERNTGASGIAGWKSSCKMYEKCAKTLGKDIAAWLNEPRANAQLGELKK